MNSDSIVHGELDGNSYDVALINPGPEIEPVVDGIVDGAGCAGHVLLSTALGLLDYTLKGQEALGVGGFRGERTPAFTFKFLLQQGLR